MLYRQLSTNGPERAAYEKRIAPFINEMPKSGLEGWRRVCDERNYAFIGTDFYQRQISRSLSCQMVSLPGTSYPETLTYIISKKSHYKGLINWR
jgi:hypothetical protein